jgi:hypothetical protein
MLIHLARVIDDFTLHDKVVSGLCTQLYIDELKWYKFFLCRNFSRTESRVKSKQLFLKGVEDKMEYTKSKRQPSREQNDFPSLWNDVIMTTAERSSRYNNTHYFKFCDVVFLGCFCTVVTLGKTIPCDSTACNWWKVAKEYCIYNLSID